MAVGPKTPSLYSRIQTHGTLTERPHDVPDARFALPSTIHWMRALAIFVADQRLDFAEGRTFYGKVQARSLPDRELNTVCEQLLFVLNQISALQSTPIHNLPAKRTIPPSRASPPIVTPKCPPAFRKCTARTFASVS